MALFPKVKLKAVVSFPATVLDGVGIDTVKQNGTYQFNLDFGDFAPPVAGISNPAHQNALLWNDTTGQYTLAPVTVISAGGSVPEAPNDGVQYGRQSLTWTPVVTGGTPSSSNPLMDGIAAPGALSTYSRGDHIHPSDTSRAPLASPVFTGDPKAPTPTVGDNDTSIATTAFVMTAVGSGGPLPSNTPPLVDGVAAPGALTTYARGDHIHPTDTTRQTQDADLDVIAALTGTGIARRTSNAPVWTVGSPVVNAELASMPAYTFKGNNTGGAAVPTDVDIAALPTKASPAGGDYLLLSDQAASGGWKKLAISTLPGASGGISEAPNDGQIYGRQSLGWSPVSGTTSPSNVLPVMDGTALAGTSVLYSRGDHVHPTDTSRAPLANPVFTGNPQAPTPTAGDNDTSIATTAFVTTAVAGVVTVSPSNANPAMDGAVAPGISALYSRGDHVHPTDTSRAAVSALPVPAIATPLIESGTGAVGTSVKYAREDHVHPISGGGGGASVTISDTPPASPSAGNLWWESDTGNLFIYYNDGNSSQWVAIGISGGGTIGVIDGSNAPAGSVGEFLSSTLLVGSAVPVVTTTAKDVIGLSIPPGDWDIWGTVITSPTGGTLQTQIFAWLSTTSATLPTPPAGGVFGFQLPYIAGSSAYVPAGPIRYSSATTATVFLSTYCTFTAGSGNSAYGAMYARRRR